jgi:hypothetical protein
MMPVTPTITPEMIREQGRRCYANLGAFGGPVMLHERQGSGFVDHGPIQACVSAYVAREVIPGGPIEQGDLKATIAKTAWPATLTRRLGRGDRVTWHGELYAVINQDDATRSAADEQFGVDLQLRGGAG